MSDNARHIPLFIRRLMPTANEAELQEATDNFVQYLRVMRRVYERLTFGVGISDSPEIDSERRFGDVSDV